MRELVSSLPAPADGYEAVEYETGLLANESCAEVVHLPLPADANNKLKSGCGIDMKRLANRLGRKFKEWLQ